VRPPELAGALLGLGVVVLLYPRRGAETPIGGSSSLEHLPANSPPSSTTSPDTESCWRSPAGS